MKRQIFQGSLSPALIGLPSKLDARWETLRQSARRRAKFAGSERVVFVGTGAIHEVRGVERGEGERRVDREIAKSRAEKAQPGGGERGGGPPLAPDSGKIPGDSLRNPRRLFCKRPRERSALRVFLFSFIKFSGGGRFFFLFFREHFSRKPRRRAFRREGFTI